MRRDSISLSVIVLIIFVLSAYGFRLQRDSMRDTWRRLSMASKFQSITIRSNDIDKAVKFYEPKLGKPESQGNGFAFKLAEGSLKLEKWIPKINTEKYDSGEGYRGLSILQPNVKDVYDQSVMSGSEIRREYGDYKYGASDEPFEDDKLQHPVQYGDVYDPHGFLVELQESAEKYHRLMIHVVDLKESTEFYRDVLGFTCCKIRSSLNNVPKEAAFSHFLGEKEREGVNIELFYEYSTDKLRPGNAFSELALSVDDLSKVIEELKARKITHQLDGQDVLVEDPNGHKIRVVSHAK